MKSSYFNDKFIGSYGYDFRDQDAPDYSANGTYSAVGNTPLYFHPFILVFHIYNIIMRRIYFSAPLCSKGKWDNKGPSEEPFTKTPVFVPTVSKRSLALPSS